MRLFPPFFPKSESKVLPRLAIEGRIVAFSLDTLRWCYHSREVSHWKNTLSFTTQYLLRDLLHNSLQVTKFSLLICRSVQIAWCSLPSSIVGWSGVPTRFRTIWSFKVKCSRVTFLPADCRNVAFFTTHTSLVYRYLLQYISLSGQFERNTSITANILTINVIRCLQISRCDHTRRSAIEPKISSCLSLLKCELLDFRCFYRFIH